MRSPPIDVILSWPTANYTNPITRGPVLLIVELTLLPLALICLTLRLYVRLEILNRSWWDDWLMVVACFFTIGVTACVCLATSDYGWDRHVWDVRFSQLITGRKISIAAQTLFVFASGFTKLSILASYLRIATEKSYFRIITWATFAVTVAVTFIFLLVLWLQCIPIKEYWNLFDNNRHCMDEGPPLMAQISITILTDFVIFFLPMPTLFHLDLPKAQRVSLMIVFGFGGLVCVAGCLRLYYTHLTVYETYDVTWEGFHLWIWTAVEVNLGIICGCVPALKPLAFRAAARFGSYQKSGSWGSTTRSRKDRQGEIEMGDSRAIVGAADLYPNEKMTIEESIDETLYRNGSVNTTKPLVQVNMVSWYDEEAQTRNDDGDGMVGRTMSAEEITRSSFGLKR